MKEFLIGLLFIVAVFIFAAIGFLLYPLLIILGFFMRWIVLFLLAIFAIWLLGKFILLIWEKAGK
jgi:hypothetical protein